MQRVDEEYEVVECVEEEGECGVTKVELKGRDEGRKKEYWNVWNREVGEKGCKE